MGFVSLSRVVDPAVLDPSKPHTVSFQVRLDEFAGVEEEFRFSIKGGTEVKSDNSKDTVWFLLTQNGYWYVVGAGADGELAFKNTQMKCEPQINYAVTVTVDPEKGIYSVEIENGETTYSSPEIASVAGAGKAPAELTFAGTVQFDAGSVFSWSLGNVVVSGSR